MHELVDLDFYADSTGCSPESSAAEGTRVLLDAEAPGRRTAYERWDER